MLTFSLQSGSNGNAIYVEAGEVRLLFDAGISGRQAKTRMQAKGRHPAECNALIISHNHSDHVGCAGIYQRMFELPIYMTEKTYRASRSQLGTVNDVRRFTAGDLLEFGDVKVWTIRTPHDGVDGVCFVVEHEHRRLGIFTDLGHPFPALAQALQEVDAAYLESNYDRDMLVHGPYPEMLKQRIMGKGGHLSNDESADLAARSLNGRIKWLALAHLSKDNNEPSLALAAHHRRIGQTMPLYHASRYDAGETLHV